MTKEGFWEIVASCCGSDPTAADDWYQALVDRLAFLQPEEIVEWNHIFDDCAAKAYTIDLWGAAYLINGGAFDDGFYYFRCWLIGMGKQIYESALLDPDSLADVVADMIYPRIDAEAEIYAVAHQAWMKVTGMSYADSYPARNEAAKLEGDRWDFEDDREVRRRLPRLAAIYLDK